MERKGWGKRRREQWKGNEVRRGNQKEQGGTERRITFHPNGKGCKSMLALQETQSTGKKLDQITDQ